MDSNIAECPANFERSPECACVIAVGKHGSFALESVIQSLGEPCCQALHRTREGATLLRFYEQVNMIRLHRKVHQPSSQTLLCSVK
jgi:hypothetical protein